MAEKPRLYRSVLNQMLSLIDSGQFPAGGRLPPERELAERFNVSRPTIREAIIALEVLNRVQVKTGSGIYVLEHRSTIVSDFNSITPWELTESRALIEGEAAALAATHITDEELRHLEDSLHEMADENAIGEKNELLRGEDVTYYNGQHAMFHPFFNDYLDKFGFRRVLILRCSDMQKRVIRLCNPFGEQSDGFPSNVD